MEWCPKLLGSCHRENLALWFWRRSLKVLKVFLLSLCHLYLNNPKSRFVPSLVDIAWKSWQWYLESFKTDIQIDKMCSEQLVEQFTCLQLLAVHAVIPNTTYFTTYLHYFSLFPQCQKPWNNQKYSFLAKWLSILHMKYENLVYHFFHSSMECDSFPKGQICVKLTNQYKWCQFSQHSLLEIDEYHPNSVMNKAAVVYKYDWVITVTKISASVIVVMITQVNGI